MANSDFGVPEFKAYNLNPYSGGYDLTLAYGKPLPPSHSTCYPPSFNNPHPSLNGFSYGSIPSPYVTSSSKLHLTTPKPQNKEKENKNHGNQNGKLVDNISTNGYGNGHGFDDYSHQSWTDYGYGKNEDSCNQDDLGPCPSIFGYWPCLYKMNKKSTYDQNNGDEQEKDHRNQWEVTAEYLFGTTLYPYGESIQVDVSYGYNSSYRYQKHNIEEPTSIKQLKYNEKSPTPKLGFYGTYQEDDCLPLGRQSNLAIVPITYGNDGNYEIQPPSVKVDYNEQSPLQRLFYGQSDHAEDYPLFDNVEYNGRSSFQSPGFDEAYDSQEFPALGYVSNESNLVTSYEPIFFTYREPSRLLHVGYNELCEVYHKEEYHGQDFFSESMDKYNYYKQRSYYNE
ncbi:hypothetical protein MKX03_037508 [Papaver bracteatum]|nr:hypothetical protein MKX03_037508 [Papaver bracteatum]